MRCDITVETKKRPILRLLALMSRNGFYFLCVMTMLSCPGWVHATEEVKIDTLVVCPLPFQSEMVPWIKHRESQGHGIVMTKPAGEFFALQQKIRSYAKRYPLKNLVLVGDCYAKKMYEGHSPPIVPRGTIRAVVNRKFGSEPIICTDNVYADIDDDLIPDMTVGRLSVDSPLELRSVINKIINGLTC